MGQVAHAVEEQLGELPEALRARFNHIRESAENRIRFTSSITSPTSSTTPDSFMPQSSWPTSSEMRNIFAENANNAFSEPHRSNPMNQQTRQSVGRVAPQRRSVQPRSWQNSAHASRNPFLVPSTTFQFTSQFPHQGALSSQYTYNSRPQESLELDRPDGSGVLGEVSLESLLSDYDTCF